MLEVITGPMFSGKTEELVRRLHRAEFADIKPVVFKPKSDTRYRPNEIMSHSGYVFRAHPIDSPDEALHVLYEGSDLYAFDEAQFFSHQLPPVVEYLMDRGSDVIVAGLDKDFRGRPFGPMPILLAMADRVSKLTAVCVMCHGEATMTHRKVDETTTIVVGGAEKYEARCRDCHSSTQV